VTWDGPTFSKIGRPFFSTTFKKKLLGIKTLVVFDLPHERSGVNLNAESNTSKSKLISSVCGVGTLYD